MKVLALNSSARAGVNSKTGLLLEHLTQGMAQAGAEVETVDLRHKKISHCLGCFSCMTKTPGKCVIKDDMTTELFARWREADLVVYATPLFHRGMNATMKAFVERTFPICEPYLVFSEERGRWTHPLRFDMPAAVILSVCGFPDPNEFDALSAHVHRLFGEGELVWAEIYRDGIEFLGNSACPKAVRDDIFSAYTQAGRELIEQKTVSSPTMERITQPLVEDLDAFARIANTFWRTCINQGITPLKFAEKNLIPRPDSIQTFIDVLCAGFDSQALGDLKAVIQFDLSGEIQGSCHFNISGGRVTGAAKAAKEPDLTIAVPFETWFEVMSGNLDGQKVFMEQQAKASGDLGLLMRLSSLLG
ncbi:MAG: NAD(P)H-dependent oxidoreductase [Desulfarculaceae bacterium]|jgi:multimeric flavodoxin WrbA